MDKTWRVLVVDDLDTGILKNAAEFLQSFMPQGTAPVWSADYFKWKLGDANPAGRGFMTVAMHGEDIVGVTSVTRKRWWDGYQEVAAAEIGDTYSHADFRREGQAAEPYRWNADPADYLNRSIFGRLVTETRTRAQATGITLIYGTPNDAATPGYTGRLGFFDYVSHHNQHFVRPGSAGLAQRFPVLRLFKGVLRGLDRGHAGAMMRVLSAQTGLKAQLVRDVGSDIDSLWERLKAGCGVGPLRDSAYFRFRFTKNPLAHYRIWALKQRDSHCGVFVTRSVTHSDGLQTHYLADWLLDYSVKGIFRFVVAHLISSHGGPLTKAYALWGERDWSAAQGLRRLGWVGKNRIPIIFYDHPDSRKLEASDPVLDFSIAASDNI